jgi:SAM-dependent methyltransferase
MRRYCGNYGTDYLSYELKNEAAFFALQQLSLAGAGFDLIEKELKHAAVSAGREKPSVLDAGCATGALLSWLRDRGWQVCGVEISPSAGYARVERGLDVRSLPLEESHFPPHSFDMVFASHLIEHLNAPAEFAREAWRILRPAGLLLITTPNIAGFQARLFGSGWRSAIFDHLYLFSVKTLGKLLSGAGFSIEGVYTWGGLAAGAAPRYLKYMADRLVKPLGLGDVMLIKARKKQHQGFYTENE